MTSPTYKRSSSVKYDPTNSSVEKDSGSSRGTRDYKIAGANCYYLAYVEEPVQSAVLDLAASLSLNVIRIWAFWEHLPQNSIFFERLDRAISIAAERGIRLILTLANNWKDFGGIPEYLDRFDLSGHDQFYRDGRCRAAYWIRAEQLIGRVNTFTGRHITRTQCILAWELANEPRCPDVKDGEQLLISWIWEMANYPVEGPQAIDRRW